MPPPSCRPPPTIANGCSFCDLCPFAVTHLHGTGLVSQQPRAARDGLVSWVQAINRPLSEATQPGADSALGAGSTRSPLVRHLNAARTTVGNDGQRRAGGSKVPAAGELRAGGAAAGRTQPAGLPHGRARANEAHARRLTRRVSCSALPRCTSTHSPALEAHAMSSSDRAARPPCLVDQSTILFFAGRGRLLRSCVEHLWKDSERRMNGGSRDGDGGDQELLEVVPVRIPSTPPHSARACVGGAAGGAGSARTLRRPAPARKARLRSGRLASPGRREEINVSGLSSSSSSRARLSHGQPRPTAAGRPACLSRAVLGWATCGVGLLQPAARSSCWSCVGRM